jgi:PAS domain S-box-containing protein
MISILYVDDEQDLLEIAKTFLERSGEFSVQISTSAKEVLDSPAIQSCDVIISDYLMPGMDGITFLKRVRERNNNIPFILFTGRGNEDIAIETINAGADFYLRKGGDPEARFTELSNRIRQAVSKRQELAANRYNQQKFQEFTEILPQMIVELDPDLQVTYANHRTLILFGINEKDLVRGVSALSFIDPSQHAKVQDNISRLMQGIGVEPQGYTAMRRDGSTFPVTITAFPVFRDKTLIGFHGIIEDDSAWEKMDEGLKESERKFRAIFENSPYPIAINSMPDGKFVAVNQAFLNSSGYSEAEVLGKSPLELRLLSIVDFGKLTAHLILSGRLENVPMTLTGKGGRGVHVQFSTIPVTINNRPVIMTMTAEVTKLRRIEEELLQKNEDLNAAFEELTSTEEELRANYNELSKKEQALQESEVKFRTLVEHALEGILILDTSGTLLFANQAAGNLIEADNFQDFIGVKNVLEFIAPESQPDVLKDFNSVAQGTDGYLARYKVITTKGREGWVESMGKSIRFSGVPAILISLRDITERQTAESVLRSSEEKFRALVEHSLDGILITDFSGNLLFANRAAGLIVDVVDYEALVGKKNVLEYVDAGSRADVIRDFGRVAQGIDAYLVHYKLITEQKREVWVECIGKKIPFRQSGAMLISMRDITERRRAEEALNESRQMLAEAMDLANLVKWEYDAKSEMFTFDDRFYAQYGTTPEYEGGYQMSVENYTQKFVHPEDRLVVIEEVEKALKSADPHYVSHREHRIIRRDGEVRHIIVRIGITKDAEGRTVKTHGANQDITERKRAEDALRMANRQLTLLTGITRHDIINKVTIILGYLRLTEKKFSDPGLHEYLKKMESTMENIQSQIEFTRVYQNLGTLDPQWIDLDTVMPREYLTENINLDARVKGVFVFADPMLEKVFFNLFDNSVRHGQRVTEIVVSYHQESGDLVIVWEDNGIGISADEKERVFERGFGKNTGLGMFLVREILSLTGIRITETGEPGKGARFEITVPKGTYRIETE